MAETWWQKHWWQNDGRYREHITTRCRNGLKAEMVQIGADFSDEVLVSDTQ